MVSSSSINKTITQGILGLMLVLVIAFFIASLCNPVSYQWVVFFFLSATPIQIIIGVLWQNNLPFIRGLDKKSQPLKGIILTGFNILSGLIVGGLTLLIVGKGHLVSTPQLAHFLIIAIIITLWLMIFANFWPIIGKVKNITLVGILTLILAYTLAFIIWKVFFNYENVANIAPWYIDFLDPKGFYNFVPAIVFIITTCPIILYFSLFDNWFLERWSGAKQPFKTIINTAFVLIIAYLFQSLFIKIFKMDMMVYMVIVPICMVFGVFLVNNMAQFSLFESVAQPLKGVYKMILATILGLLMYVVYYNLSNFVTGINMLSGKEGHYQLDLWIADTMLGISFPLVIILTGFFNFWPIKRQ